MTKSAHIKLRRLTVLLVLVVVVPLFIFWSAIVYFLLDFSHKNATSHSLTTARLVAKLGQKTFSDTLYHLENHKKELIEGLTTNNKEEVDHELKEVLYTSPFINSLATTKPDGSNFIHYVIPSRFGHKESFCPMSGKVKASDLPWFQEYLKSGKRQIVSNVFYDPCAPNYPQIAAVIPIKNNQGKVMAVQAAYYGLAEIKQWVKPLKLPAGMFVTLLDKKNNLIYSTDKASKKNRSSDGFVNYQPLVSLIQKQKRQVSMYYNPLSQEKEIIAFIPAHDKNVAILVSQSVSSIERSALTTIFHFLLVGAALLVLGLILVNLVRRAYIRENLALQRESQLKEALTQSVQELEMITTTLQKSFLPAKFPVFAGFEFGATYHSATKHALIGGDFYDAFQLDENRLAIMLGDISGRGIEATTLTSLVKNVIKAFALEKELSPVEIINKANTVLISSIEGGHFATVFFGFLEKNGCLTYVNCGHPPALLVKASGQIESLIYTGLPLGYKFAYACREETVHIDSGDVLFLYTDGLIEARKNKEFFSEAGLKKALINHLNLSAQELPLKIYQEVKNFSGGQLYDDLAILVVKRSSEVEPLQDSSEKFKSHL